MSYTVELIVPPLPAADDEAWMVVKSLRTRYPGDSRVKAPALVQLHQRLVERYPCLSSFADDDPAIDDCPWADGPMLDNFSAEMGMLAISYSSSAEWGWEPCTRFGTAGQSQQWHPRDGRLAGAEAKPVPQRSAQSAERLLANGLRRSAK